MVYEDDNVFIYEKPAGWVCASPNPKVKSTYTAVKAYLEAKSEERIDVHFVNKLPREASGLLVVTKSMEWRQHLQTHWNSFAKGMYVMVQGHLAADDELFLRPENSDPMRCLTAPCAPPTCTRSSSSRRDTKSSRTCFPRCVATIAF